MAIRDDLIKAKALIDTQEKWIKGDFDAIGSCYCSIGALLHVLDVSPRGPRHPAELVLAEAVPPDYRKFGTVRDVVDFNDDDNTTHADIMAMFDRAIAISP